LNWHRNRMRIYALTSVALLALGVCLGSRADSPVTGPQVGGRDRAFFPHNKPGHMKQDCSKCHTITPAQIDEKKFPSHASCISCHNLALEALSRPITYCGICHDGRPASKAQPALFLYPKPGGISDFGMDFSHPAHLKPRPPVTQATIPTTSAAIEVPQGIENRFETATVAERRSGSDKESTASHFARSAAVFRQDASLVNPRCFDCHKPAQQIGGKMVDFITNVGHPACFVCHGEKPLAPPSMFQCAGCHKLSGPRYPNLYGKVIDFKHSDHVYDTRPIIRGQTIFPRKQDYLCSECHQSAAQAVQLSDIKLPQQNYCMECHNGNLGLPDPLATNVINSLNRR